ncbi:MAG: hypothetical protein HQM15_01145 [Deltaproteobacteria bacterium]|nr:hypothetical protein [Deltaproteobacteria bacterium]
MYFSGSAAAEATKQASENAMKGTIESSRLQADAQIHISDNERHNADADRAIREKENAHDAQMTDRWFSYLDNMRGDDNSIDQATLVTRQDGVQQSRRIDLSERQVPTGYSI